jgi:glycerol-3-phosphate acyltransferase PlsY
MWARILSLLIGTLFGNFLTADVLVRLKTGQSVFQIGSGNPGMANVTHELGVPAGAAVLTGDLLKTCLAGLLSFLLFRDADRIILLYATLGTTIGHNWPIWHHFQGGKGVAVTCMGIHLYTPIPGLIADATGMLVVFFTGYLPLGAVIISSLYTILAFAFEGLEAGILALILDLIMTQRHWHGLTRVFSGEEKRHAQLFRKGRIQRSEKSS